MESVFLLVNEVTETFFADFNYGRAETKQMMPFCRIAVEKFIFDKVKFISNIYLYSQEFCSILTNFTLNQHKLIQLIVIYPVVRNVRVKIQQTDKEVQR